MELLVRISILSSLCTLCENRSQEAPYETVLSGAAFWNCALWRKETRQNGGLAILLHEVNKYVL